MKAIIGKKLGMTQIFNDKGIAIPVTVVEAGPMTIVQRKTIDRDGYKAVQCAYGNVKQKNVTKPIEGHFKKSNITPKKIIKEFDLDESIGLDIGKEIKCDIFQTGDIVDVSGKTKGHGFSGSIKRWNHHRLKMTHGTGPVHRSVGSTGSNSDPSKVIKGLQMPGQYGNENVTIQNLEIVRVDIARNVLLIKGGLPGPNNSTIVIKSALKQKKA